MVDYTSPYRIVAVSQGSQCGVSLFAPHTELLRAQGLVNVFNLPFVFAGSYGLAGQVIVNALPAYGQSDRVSGVHLIEKTDLYFGAITITWDIVSDDFDSPAGLLPIDGAAGSTEPIGEAVGLSGGVLVGNTYRFTSPFWFPYMGSFTLAPKFTFLPTASALDLNDFNLPALNASFINGVTSVSYSRTNGFIAQERTGQGSGSLYNQPHLTFTARNGEWMYNEMQRPFTTTGNPLACGANECSALAITGPEQVCVSGATFQANSANATWTASPSHLFTTTTGSGGQFTTAAAAGVRGTGTISVTSACGDVATLPVRVGEYISGTYQASASNQAGPLAEDDVVELYSNTVNIHLPYLPNTTYSFSAHSTDPAYAYQFYAYSAADATLQFTTTTPGFYMVWVTITKTSPCGTTTAEYGFAYNYDQGYRYATYPNPADDNLTVEQTSSTSNTQRSPAARGAEASSGSSTAAGTPYTVRLFDSHGVQQVQQATSTPALQLSTSKLPTGLYLLHIEVDGAVVERRRLQITH